jgi:hypothetical protein
VVENPGKTVVAVATFPVWIGPATIVGAGVTAYGATDDAIQAATGEQFDSEGYRGLSDKERRMKAGSGLVKGLEVAGAVVGANKISKPKSPSATPSTPKSSPAKTTGSKTTPPPARKFSTNATQAGSAEAELERLRRHTEFVMRAMRDNEDIVNELRAVGEKETYQKLIADIADIFKRADELFGPPDLN